MSVKSASLISLPWRGQRLTTRLSRSAGSRKAVATIALRSSHGGSDVEVHSDIVITATWQQIHGDLYRPKDAPQLMSKSDWDRRFRCHQHLGRVPRAGLGYC